MIMTESQKLSLNIFRVLMDSMARPGKILTLPGSGTILSVCSALLDHEVKFSVIGEETHENLIRDIYENSKSEYTRSDLADYVIVTGGSSSGGIKSLNRGTPEFPDRGATILYLAEELGYDGGCKISLEGPGISGKIELTIKGIDPLDIDDIRELNSEFPLGVDLFFIDRKSRVAALPRSSKIGMKE